MAKFAFQLTGLHARSEELVKATRDFDRKRITEAECEAVREEDAHELIELQKRLGAQYTIDGSFKWQDIIRPFAEKAGGFEVGPLTRFFETNTFYKKAVRKGAPGGPEFIENYNYGKLLPKNGKAVLPGPYTFARLSDLGGEGSRSAASGQEGGVDEAVELLLPVAKFLEGRGYACIEFTEPSLVYDAEKKVLSAEGFESARRAYAKFRKALSCRIQLHTFFGDFAAAPGLEGFEVDEIAIDFTRTNLDEVKADFGSKAVGLGIVDAESSLVESPQELAEFARKAAGSIGAKSFFLCPNTGLGYVPREIADKKVEALAKAAEVV
jgi:5-methyltetrahydropteroyltriglutamate--homocysteine methyltransferase